MTIPRLLNSRSQGLTARLTVPVVTTTLIPCIQSRRVVTVGIENVVFPTTILTVWTTSTQKLNDGAEGYLAAKSREKDFRPLHSDWLNLHTAVPCAREMAFSASRTVTPFKLTEIFFVSLGGHPGQNT